MLTGNLSLMDLRFNGVKFTWSDMRQNRLFCKLDRALVNGQWMNGFENSEASFLPASSSDHSPCIVRLYQRMRRRNHIFKFCNMWVHNARFIELVSEAWNVEILGTHMYWQRKMKRFQFFWEGHS